MEDKWNVDVDIPEDLEEVIHRGLQDGKAAAARRRRARRLAGRSLCCVVLVVAVFAGGVHLSPAFAAAIREIPVIGHLVRVFGENEPLVQGGSQAGEGTVTLTMERSGDTEQMRLEFPGADASLYQAEFASYPKTVTITLPGTDGVEILSEISRAKDTSQYIKSVCQLPGAAEGTTVIQLELESDADVQIQEYRDPGSLVIRLTPAEIQLDTVYSVRTLSYNADELPKILAGYGNQSVRILRDEAGLFFLELAQYVGPEEAEAAAGKAGLLVEKRTGNNVPVSFRSMEEYESSRFLDQFYEVLIQSDKIATVLDFMDQHFSQATEQEQDKMLRGLSGLLEDYEDNEEKVDWQKVASFYQMAGEALPDFVQQNVR